MRYAFAVFSTTFALTFGGCASTLPLKANLPANNLQRPAWIRIKNDGQGARGVYVAVNDTVLGYGPSNARNRPARCSLSGDGIAGIASDPQGDLLVPESAHNTVVVYAGPHMCGPVLGRFHDPYGSPANAATLNAKSGTIYVATNTEGSSPRGKIAICTMAGGCSSKLANPEISGFIFGVAVDQNGGVYATGEESSSFGSSMVYWARGRGHGIRITAYQNFEPGGLDIDHSGNIVTLDTGGPPAVWVYSGCPSACVAHGPFPLKSAAFGTYARVNRADSTLQVADIPYSQVDVYAYAGTSGITYEYSYNNGIQPSTDVEGIARNPAAE
ncbi:MAG: hypothetical protein JOZ77_08570 [Candidatus Eremiobacteraeota bacterium]|nr:hypothetical protein [Candidatus Eremiobacteraeota bacterium]